MKERAIWLRLEGVGDAADAVVLVEVNGQWVEVIRERASGCFSHIVEPSGIEAAIARAKGGGE